MAFFSLPIPRSQRLPLMNWRPPLNLLMVRRQLLVQPLQLAIRVEYSRVLIFSMGSMVVAWPSYRSLAISAAPKAPMIPAISGRMASHSAMRSKLPEHGVVVEGSALYDDVLPPALRRRIP